MPIIGVKTGRGIVKDNVKLLQIPLSIPQQKFSGIIYQKGDPGPQGPQGPAGDPGPKILNGTGDPSSGITSQTVIGDYYLDNASGNYWQREAFTGTINATTIILPGNVQWKRVANLKGESVNIASYLEGKQYIRYFMKAMFDYNASPAGKIIGIACFGDSISSHVWGSYIKGMSGSYPITGLSYPGSLQSAMTVSFSGVFSYKHGAVSNQNVLNGLISGTLSRSGTTVTLTAASAHGLIVGDYVTISSSSDSAYDGRYLVVTRPSSTTLTFTISGTPSANATCNVYGGVMDFTYVPSGDHVEMANGAVINLDSGQAKGHTSYVSFFATGPGMGSVQVELINYDTLAQISTQTIDLSGASLGATKVTLNANANTKHRIRITATNKVVFLHTYSLYDNGIVPVDMGRGGTTFTQNCYSNQTILNYLVAQLNVKLMFVQAREEGLPGSLTTLANRLNTLTKTDKFIVAGSANASETVTPAQSELFRKMAEDNKYAFFDMLKALGSWTELNALEVGGDGVHPDEAANAISANNIHGETGNVNLMEKTVSRRSIDHRLQNNPLAVFQTLDFVNGSDPSQKFNVFYGAGSTLAEYINIQNVSRLFLGPLATAPQITAAGSSIYLRNASNVNTKFFAGSFDIDQGGNNRLVGKMAIGQTADSSNLSWAQTMNIWGNIFLTGKIMMDKAAANPSSGSVALVAGTATINTTQVNANSDVFITVFGTPIAGTNVTVSSQANGTFTITSSDNTDTRTVKWFVVN